MIIFLTLTENLKSTARRKAGLFHIRKDGICTTDFWFPAHEAQQPSWFSPPSLLQSPCAPSTLVHGVSLMPFFGSGLDMVSLYFGAELSSSNKRDGHRNCLHLADRYVGLIIYKLITHTLHIYCYVRLDRDMTHSCVFIYSRNSDSLTMIWY